MGQKKPTQNDIRALLEEIPRNASRLDILPIVMLFKYLDGSTRKTYELYRKVMKHYKKFHNFDKFSIHELGYTVTSIMRANESIPDKKDLKALNMIIRTMKRKLNIKEEGGKTIQFSLSSRDIQDSADWRDMGGPKEKWLVDDVAKVGSKISFQPTAEVLIDEINEGTKEKEIMQIKDNIYHINAEILGGYGNSHFAHLVVDCGFPIRIHIYTDGPKEDTNGAFWFQKGKYLSFDAPLSAVFCDDWQGAIISYVEGIVKNRKKINVQSKNAFDLMIQVNGIVKRRLKFFDGSNSNDCIILDSDHDCFRFDFVRVRMQK